MLGKVLAKIIKEHNANLKDTIADTISKIQRIKEESHDTVFFFFIDILHTSNCGFTHYFQFIKKKQKKIGWGSLSLLLAFLGMAVSFKFGNYILGDHLFSLLDLSARSNSVDNTGFHYTMFLSIIFFIPSLIIAYKKPEDFGAKIGKWISSIYLILIIIAFIFFIIS
ncbi:hypothetical protein JOD82_002096 [Paenibacillus sp. 1182]|uniref:hypothetical protein n=1 Tax=Paenibacillus sp. 1182 TaxID=2806565 RepID=UPI001B57B6DE|nr:hypothetical protein [Paenibacillus sp. 1182]MBP1309076.1 hypothetical protein [Paenibacillus sp. 1182]